MAFHIHFIWAEVLFWNTKNCLFRIWILRVFHSNTYQTIMAQFNSTLWKNWKSVVLCLALLVLIVTEAAPAKGGSKSMMKNRWISFFVCAIWTPISGAGQKGQGRGEGGWATILLVRTGTLVSVAVGSGLTSLHVLVSATTTSSTESH